MTKPEAGGPVPHLTFPKLGGGEIAIGGARDRWTLFVVYRGKHCGRCKRYLTGLEKMKSDWENAGFEIAVVSADPKGKAQADKDAFGWSFDIGFDLSEAQMQDLGLYISDPLSPDETDRRFAEPGVFCIRPDGTYQIVALSNGPSARPDLTELLDGMIFTIENDKPARGTA
ncbi:redoxin domain-containing protein [Litoreibacter roseus]|uniref:Thioredoxin peroxidase n=1 Tax=Litoreibacter roseus TaxID=2601869 RepID=A0A6N6JI90_9RHOB|nr:redoxin domain-containing protein [Litoreibacter roseus]GFE66083.1 thioredoxin peroxidase [Litoreibacter roseus]